MSFSSDSVLAQVRFQIAIRAVPAPLTGVCYPLVSTARVGQSVTWIVSPDNGNPPYTYAWSGTDGLSGSLGYIEKAYMMSGTKTATVIITSGGSTSSLPIPCISSVIITATTAGGGGSGSGGGSSVDNHTSAPPKDDTNPKLNSPPIEDGGKKDPLQKLACNLAKNPTFREAKDYLLCSDIISPRVAEVEYEYEKFASRKEILGIATKVHLQSPILAESLKLSRLQGSHSSTQDTTVNYSYHFLDIGIPGQPEWVSRVVEEGLIFGLISDKNTYFRPEDVSSRSESFAMLMKSVCMDTEQSLQKNWQQRIYEVALRNGITTRSWADFNPNSPILRQEIFLITARLRHWKDITGGCDTHPQIAPQSTEAIVHESILSKTPEFSQESITNTQKPGTFGLLYEDETEKVYAYIVKSGGTPDGVRAQYIRVFSRSKLMASRITIHDIAGIEYPEDRWLLSGELVYVTFKK